MCIICVYVHILSMYCFRLGVKGLEVPLLLDMIVMPELSRFLPIC